MDIGTFFQYGINAPDDAPGANIITANLFAHYDFQGLRDLGPNGYDLVAAGNAIQTDDGYRLNSTNTADASLKYSFGAVTNSAYTLQVAVITHVKDPWNHYLGLRGPTSHMNIGLDGSASDIRWGFQNDASTAYHVDGTTVPVLGTTYLYTMKWNGAEHFGRVNKTEVSPSTAVAGSFTPDHLELITKDLGEATVVYAAIYTASLSNTNCDANYDAIKAHVNTRPGVALP